MLYSKRIDSISCLLVEASLPIAEWLELDGPLRSLSTQTTLWIYEGKNLDIINIIKQKLNATQIKILWNFKHFRNNHGLEPPGHACCKTNTHMYMYNIYFYRRCPFTVLWHTANLPFPKENSKWVRDWQVSQSLCTVPSHISCCCTIGFAAPSSCRSHWECADPYLQVPFSASNIAAYNCDHLHLILGTHSLRTWPGFCQEWKGDIKTTSQLMLLLPL